ncbi:MAG: hypothetical protein ACLP5H_34230 [Desulfomonilaceae bacterium]
MEELNAEIAGKRDYRPTNSLDTALERRSQSAVAAWSAYGRAQDNKTTINERFGGAIERAMTPRSPIGDSEGTASGEGKPSLVDGLQAVVNNFMKGVEQDAALRREKIQVEIKIKNDRGELTTWETT